MSIKANIICIGPAQDVVSVYSLSIFHFCSVSVSTKSRVRSCDVVLSFESVDELLWCDHSNETTSEVR